MYSSREREALLFCCQPAVTEMLQSVTETLLWAGCHWDFTEQSLRYSALTTRHPSFPLQIQQSSQSHDHWLHPSKPDIQVTQSLASSLQARHSESTRSLASSLQASHSESTRSLALSLQASHAENTLEVNKGDLDAQSTSRPCGESGKLISDQGIHCEGTCRWWYHLDFLQLTKEEVTALCTPDSIQYWKCSGFPPPLRRWVHTLEVINTELSKDWNCSGMTTAISARVFPYNRSPPEADYECHWLLQSSANLQTKQKCNSNRSSSWVTASAAKQQQQKQKQKKQQQ